MSMHDGLDLSRFSKVSSDKKSTTLRHAKGHEVKIVHSAMTPAMRGKIEALPMAKGGKVKMYADSDEPVSQNDNAPVAGDIDPGSPASAEGSPASAGEAPADAGDTQQPEAAASETEAAPAAAADSAPTATAAPEPASPAVVPDTQKTAAQIAQEMTDHDLRFQKDVAAGKIRPETYGELFAKQGTAAKIGTMFGLLLSGAGSGLSHQPNAVLEMMNKQIQNDFEAQKATQENAKNWRNLSYQHELQKAEIQRYAKENNLSDEQVKNLEAEIRLKSDTHTINRMQIGAYQDNVNRLNKLPPGPGKDQAINSSNLIGSALMNDISNSNNQTASKIKAAHTLRGEDQSQVTQATQPAASDNGIDLQKFNLLKEQGQIAEKQGLPGGIRSSDVPGVMKEATDVADNRAIAKIYDSSFKKLNSLALGGQLNPQLRAAELNSLGAEIARATTGRFNMQDSVNQADGMFPSAKDWGQARAEKYRKAMEYFAGKESGTPNLDSFGLKTPFPFSGELQQNRKVGGMEGKIVSNPQTGERRIMKDGKWQPLGATKRASK